MTALPNKYVPIDHSLLGVSSLLVEMLEDNETVSSLWERAFRNQKVRTFDRFADALSLLFAANLIDMRGGVIFRSRN